MIKKHKIIFIIGIIVVFLFLLGVIYYLMPTNIAVLGYHDFTDGVSTNDLQVESSKFEAEMAYLANNNYQSLTLEDLSCYVVKTCQLNKKSVLITMDDGWINELKIAAPILKKYNLNAVIFYIGSNQNGDNANFMSIDDLKTIKNDYPNIEIASHTYDLHHENDYLKDYDAINADFNKMSEVIDTKYLAYPYGFKSDNYEKALKENNYKLAFTFGPGKEHRKATANDNKYAVPRLNISNSMSLFKFKLRLWWPF